MAETEIIYSANDDRSAGHRGGSAKKALAARRMPSGTERYEIGRSPASRAVISRVTIAGMREAKRLSIGVLSRPAAYAGMDVRFGVSIASKRTVSQRPALAPGVSLRARPEGRRPVHQFT
jgi:hypothetical protein